MVMRLACPAAQPRLSEADDQISTSDRVGASCEHLSKLEAEQGTAPPSPSQDSLDFIIHMEVVRKSWRVCFEICNNHKLNNYTTFLKKGIVVATLYRAKRSEDDAYIFSDVDTRTKDLILKSQNTNSSLICQLQSQRFGNYKLFLEMICCSILT